MRLVLSSALLVMFGCSLDAHPSRGRDSEAEAATATPPTHDAAAEMYAAAGKRAEPQDAGAPHTASDAAVSDAAMSDAMTPEPSQKPSGMKGAPSAPSGSAALPGSSNSPGSPRSSDSPGSKGSSSSTPGSNTSASSGKPGQSAHSSTDSPDAAPPHGDESHGGRHEGDRDSSSEERSRDPQQRDDDSTDRSSDDSSDDDRSAEGQTPNGGDDHNGDSTGSTSDFSGALLDQIFNLVDSILALSFGGPQPRDVSRLVEAIVGLVAVPVDELTGSDLGRLLTDLSETEACTKSDSPQCTELCSLLASDCSVCANDTSCLKAARRMCEPLGIRTCH